MRKYNTCETCRTIIKEGMTYCRICLMYREGRTATCNRCGEPLPTPSWLKCLVCPDVLRRRQERSARAAELESVWEIRKERKLRRKKRLAESGQYEDLTYLCDKDKALMSRVLVYDEDTFDIIGFRKPRHMLS